MLHNQVLPWQFFASVMFPVQGIPPVKFLVLLCIPIPHDEEQALQASQAVQVPSSVWMTKFYICFELHWIIGYQDSFLFLTHCLHMAFQHKMVLDMMLLFLYEYLFRNWWSKRTTLPKAAIHHLKVWNRMMRSCIPCILPTFVVVVEGLINVNNLGRRQVCCRSN